MNREEILDMAMDILDNTDATLEEAMGVALESQMRKMKAEARKTGWYGKVANRQMLKNSGRLESDRRTLDDARREYRARRDKPQVRRLEDKIYSSTERNTFPGGVTGRLDKGARQAKRYLNNSEPPLSKYGDDEYRTTVRTDRMGGFSKRHGSDTFSAVAAHNGRGTMYRPKASKEAAIMDTALDFLDMYDVSLEEAIDMAYDYLID